MAESKIVWVFLSFQIPTMNFFKSFLASCLGSLVAFIVAFFLLFFSFFCGVGTGVTAINNLGQIGAAQGYTDVTMFVTLFGVFNFLGRLGGGSISEYYIRWAFLYSICFYIFMYSPFSSFTYLSCFVYLAFWIGLSCFRHNFRAFVFASLVLIGTWEKTSLQLPTNFN